VPLLPSIGPIGTYFGKLLEILLKQAKVAGCKPTFQARLSKLSVNLSTLHVDIIIYITTVYENKVSLLPSYSKEVNLTDASLLSKQD
jgi:hypothetical protein